MGLFEKNKNGKHADNSDYIPEGTSGLKDPSFIHTAPYALTPDEVLSRGRANPKKAPKNIAMQGGTSPLEALKNKVKTNAAPIKVEEKSVKTETVLPNHKVDIKKDDELVLLGDETEGLALIKAEVFEMRMNDALSKRKHIIEE